MSAPRVTKADRREVAKRWLLDTKDGNQRDYLCVEIYNLRAILRDYLRLTKVAA